MSQVHTEIKNGKLTITIDVSPKAVADAGLSKSGKSKLVASTNGFVALGEGIKASLNVIHQ